MGQRWQLGQMLLQFLTSTQKLTATVYKVWSEKTIFFVLYSAWWGPILSYPFLPQHKPNGPLWIKSTSHSSCSLVKTSLRAFVLSTHICDFALISFRSLSNIPLSEAFPDHIPSLSLFTNLHILLYFFLNNILCICCLFICLFQLECKLHEVFWYIYCLF